MRELDLSKLGQFEPKAAREAVPEPGAQEKPWPSREEQPDNEREGQFTIRAKLSTIQRFKDLCRDGRARYTYADMLEILMDEHEKGRP